MTVNWVWTRWCHRWIIEKKETNRFISQRCRKLLVVNYTESFPLSHPSAQCLTLLTSEKIKRLSWHFNWLTYSFVFTASEVRIAKICDCVCSAPPNAGRLKSMCVALVWKCLWSEVQLKTEKEEKWLQVTSLPSRWDFFGLNSTRAATEVEEDQTVLSDSFKSFICSLTRNKS